MRIEIVKPHSDYPFAYAHVAVTVNVDGSVEKVLATHRATLLGRWEPHIKNGTIETIKAPVLLEDEHVKPTRPKRPRKKS